MSRKTANEVASMFWESGKDEAYEHGGKREVYDVQLTVKQEAWLTDLLQKEGSLDNTGLLEDGTGTWELKAKGWLEINLG